LKNTSLFNEFANFISTKLKNNYNLKSFEEIWVELENLSKKLV
jgi:uncharacterized protein YozE (UPF0346 family)